MLTRIIAALMSIIIFGVAMVPVQAKGENQMLKYENTTGLRSIPKTEEEIFEEVKEEFAQLAFDIEWCGMCADQDTLEKMIKVSVRVTSLKPVLTYGLPDMRYVTDSLNYLIPTGHLSDEFVEILCKKRFNAFVEKVKDEPSPSEAKTTSKQVDVTVVSNPLEYTALVCQWVNEICLEQNFDNPALIKAMIECESSFKPNSVSSCGCEGLMQLTPRYFIKAMEKYAVTDLCKDARGNVEIGVDWVKTLVEKYDGDLSKVLVAYNLGPSKVDVDGIFSNGYSVKVLSKVGDYM